MILVPSRHMDLLISFRALIASCVCHWWSRALWGDGVCSSYLVFFLNGSLMVIVLFYVDDGLVVVFVLVISLWCPVVALRHGCAHGLLRLCALRLWPHALRRPY